MESSTSGSQPVPKTPTSSDDPLLYAGIVLLVLGILIAGWTGYRLTHLVATEGWVAMVDSDNTTGKLCRIVFSDLEGGRHWFVAGPIKNRMGSEDLNLDQIVEVLYDPANPDRTAEIGSHYRLWVPSEVLTVAGLAILGVYFFRRRTSLD